MRSPRDKIVNVCIIGNTGVGKTCLVRKFENSYINFADPKHKPEATIGADFAKRRIAPTENSNYYVDLCITDISGEKTLYFDDSNIQKIIRHADIILYAYDVGDQKSFDELNEKWIIPTNKQNPNAKKILVATKNDKTEHVVEDAQAEKYAKENRMGFVKSSAFAMNGLDDLEHTILVNCPENKKIIAQGYTGSTVSYRAPGSSHTSEAPEAQNHSQPPANHNTASMPAENSNRDEVIGKLQAYINRIDGYQLPNQPNTNHYESFHCPFFKESRGLNRKANVLLAAELIDEIKVSENPNDLFSATSIAAMRTNIIKEKLSENERENYTPRFFLNSAGINSSELNDAIKLARKLFTK